MGALGSQPGDGRSRLADGGARSSASISLWLFFSLTLLDTTLAISPMSPPTEMFDIRFLTETRGELDVAVERLPSEVEPVARSLSEERGH
jgi:hypothetical protein